jgi:hypothetical protein
MPTWMHKLKLKRETYPKKNLLLKKKKKKEEEEEGVG